tara:strand:+ start:269 stop:697 length:429 start_codon:yes stop_codon:yes gene_type:complete
VEHLLHDLIVDNTSFIDIKPKNSKHKKEKDHLFVDEENKIIYYAEIKGNLNLDTEKSKATVKKCIDIANDLKCDEYTVKWCLVGVRYLSHDQIPNNIKNKYNDIQHNVIGVNDYLDLLRIQHQFDMDTYVSTLNDIATIISR